MSSRDGCISHLNDAGRFVSSSLRLLHSDTDGVAIDTHVAMPIPARCRCPMSLPDVADRTGSQAAATE
jgi:hypothetical protein